MKRATLLTLTAALLLTGNVFAAAVTQYLKFEVTENSNVPVAQTFSLVYAFSANGTEGLNGFDNGNQFSINDPANDVYPFSVTNFGDVITQQDARPGLANYRTLSMGFLSKFPATIKVVVSAYGNTIGDSTNRPAYAWIEQISTGHIYYCFGDTVQLDIPANINYTPDFILHTGPYIEIEKNNETCFAAFDGDISIHNPNYSGWQLEVYRNTILFFSGTVFQPDTLLENLNEGTYTVVTSIHAIHVDSTVLIITGDSQMTAGFNISNYTPTTDDAVSFTNASVTGNLTVYYYWSFGDGNDDTQANAAYQYSTAGMYEVALTVTNDNGCSVTATDTVYVSPGLPDINSFNSLLNNNSTAPNQAASALYEKPATIFAAGSQRIMITQQEATLMNITIMNVSGQLISTTQTTELNITLDVPAAGIYIVSMLNAKKEMETKKIVVAN